MASVIRTKLSVILKTVRDRLITKLRFNPSRVSIAVELPTGVPDTQADQTVYLKPLSQAPDDAVTFAAGRVDTRLSRQVAVVLRTRLHLDELYSDEALLTDSSLGHLDVEHAILDALQTFLPTDKDDNALCYEPFQVRPSTMPDKDSPPNGWGQSALVFTLDYEADLDLAAFTNQ